LGSAQCSGELEVVRPVDADPLIIPGWSKAKLNRCPVWKSLNWQEVRTVELEAVSSECVNLIRGISAANETRPITAVGTAKNHQHVATQSCPFALDPHEIRSHVKDQVASLDCVCMPDTDAQSCGVSCDCKLGNRTLLVRRQHQVDVSRRLGWAVS
jgi:hypothetical protein